MQPAPLLRINSEDARVRKIDDGNPATVESPEGVYSPGRLLVSKQEQTIGVNFVAR